MDFEYKLDLLSVLREIGFEKEPCVLALHQLENGCIGVGQAVINALAMIEAQQSKVNQPVAPIEPVAPVAPVEQVV